MDFYKVGPFLTSFDGREIHEKFDTPSECFEKEYPSEKKNGRTGPTTCFTKILIFVITAYCTKSDRVFTD